MTAATKSAARRKVRTELKQGRLVKQPCVVCGDAEVEAHHEDYAKPLEVVWLCRDHHAWVHRKPRWWHE